jgi:hypothetical protein
MAGCAYLLEDVDSQRAALVVKLSVERYSEG